MGFLDSLENDFSSAANGLSQQLGLGNSLAKQLSTSSDLDSPDQVLATLQQIQASQNILTSSLMSKNLMKVSSLATAVGNWNQNFPYRFLIASVDTSGNINVKSIFRLPINPQDLTVTTPYANRLTVTTKGILEESNGAPIKQITINATTGVYIGRESADQESGAGIIGSLFGNTLAAATGAVSTTLNALNGVASGLSSVFGGSNGGVATANADPELSKPNIKLTGYYQYNMLRLFLDTYAELKKSPGGQNYRLIFEMTKDQQMYYVSMQNLTSRRSASSPMETTYSIQMIAYGAADYNSSNKSIDTTGTIARDQNTFRQIFNSLNQLRNGIGQFSQALSVANNDIQNNIVGPVNNTILLSKDVLSLATTIADFPTTLNQSITASVINNWSTISPAHPDLQKTYGEQIAQIQNESTGNQSSDPFNAPGSSGSQQQFTAATFNQLNFTNSIQTNEVPLTYQQQTAINNQITIARSINQNNIQTLINNLQALSDTIYPSIITKDPMDPEWDLLYSIQDSISSLYRSLADGSFQTSLQDNVNATQNAGQQITALAFWQANTNLNGIPFSSPQAKIAVPFPFRSTLEELALIYLGDATRWFEIAALNGLQAPYIDEDGFYYTFLGNGLNDYFNVGSGTNLYVGQTIYIQSNSQISSQRKILAINQITSTNFQIIVDGPMNLSSFTTADNATMKAFLPYTVNSMRQIFVPSTNTAPDYTEFNTKPITFLKDTIDNVQFSKIDFLLDDNFDLAITNDGFVNLAYGTANLIQAAKLKVATVAKSMILDPNYGSAIDVGTAAADVNIQDLVNNLSISFQNDPRFNAPSEVSFNLNNNELVMNILASVKQQNGILPITIPLS